jgi:class 3 adenylate cyclase/tetratricopeptide (TPR) repeat protein
MQCPRCRAENREGRRFCGECGLSFASACPSCGFLNEGSEKFCGGCGKSLAAAPTPAESRFTSPHSYTPKHLAEKILTSKTALEGERKQVTVLFADLKGSMELLADRDPEEARNLLDPVLERMIEAVHHYEGTVNQVMGDGIMALFGAPIAHEDHAVRACQSAIRMQQAIRSYDDVRGIDRVPIRIRIGLNSGDVLVRAIGSDLHMDYTAVGSTTHLAARMEQLAEPGHILLAEGTARLVSGFVELKSLGPISVKGLTRTVSAYEVAGTRLVRNRLQVAADRGLSPFIGRHDESIELMRALQLARQEHGQVVAVVGEAGVGKSRFIWEFVRSSAVDGCTVIETGSVSYGQATPWEPIADLLRSYFEIDPRSHDDQFAELIRRRLRTPDADADLHLAALMGILGRAVRNPIWTGLESRERRALTLDAVRSLLVRESLVRPLVVVVEDLHWIDAETQDVLGAVIDILPGRRILLLVSYRPEYQHAWGGRSYYTQLHLGALSASDAEELLDSLMKEAATPAAVRQSLIQRAQGNPFFLEELVRTLVETGVLRGTPDAYEIHRTPHELPLPATVHAVLAARIDRLRTEEKRVLQTASVIGKHFTVPLLQRLVGLSMDDLRAVLRRLQAGEFIYVAALVPEEQLSFQHALTYEVAYGTLLSAHRKQVHSAIVAAADELYTNRLSELSEWLAAHAGAAELWEKVVDYQILAAAKAFMTGTLTQTFNALDGALETAARLRRTPDNLRRAIDVRIQAYSPLFVRGDIDRLNTLLEEAASMARELQDQGRLALVLGRRSGTAFVRARYADGIRYGQEAARIGETLDDLEIRVTAHHFLGFHNEVLGNFAQAVQYFRHNTDGRDADFARQPLGGLGIAPYVFGCAWLASCFAQMGEFDQAISYGERGLAAAQSAYSEIAPSLTLAFALGSRGKSERAVALAEHVVTACETRGYLAFLSYAQCIYGLLLGGAEQGDKGLQLLERGINLHEALGLRTRLPMFKAWLAELLLVTSRIGDAEAAARESLELARELGERGAEAYALLHLGAAFFQQRRVQESREILDGALMLANEIGMRPLVAHCHLGLGKLCRRTGEREQAREHLTTANTMYREMGMTYWLEQVEAELQALS